MATICVTGRLGRDGELKSLQSGKKVLSFSIADDVGFGDKKKTQWLKCALFGDRAEKLAQYLTKGTLVEVSGIPSVETWSKDGQANGCIAVSVNELKLHGGGNREDKPAADRGRATSRDVMDSDIPF
jgi:single-strand DNA-binding protein